MVTPSQLPHGVSLRPLTPHVDARGTLVELHRDTWEDNRPTPPKQWNAVSSVANTVRGFHCHADHTDCLILVRGHMRVGMRDLRPDSPTTGLALVIDLTEQDPQRLVIPPGVGHVFHFPVDSLHIYGMDFCWSMKDEAGCRWDDPGLELPWTIRDPLISERDREAGSLAQLVDHLFGTR